jgi:hypothetical protein
VEDLVKYAVWLIPLLLFACAEPVLNSPASPEASPSGAATAHDGRLSGLVRDRESGALLANLTVRLDDQSVVTDAQGFYRFENVPAGELKLIVAAPGYSPYTDTLTFNGGRQVRDITLGSTGAASPLPSLSPSGSPQPEVSATPIFLPDPDVSAQPNPTSSPTATPNPTPTPTPVPSPTATPAYDPLIDEVKTSELFVKRDGDRLELTLSLQRNLNGPPVPWQWGSVRVSYTLGKPLGSPAELDNSEPLQGGSGSTQLPRSQENYFPVFVSPTELDEYVFVYYEVTLPGGRMLSPVRAAYRIN